MGIFGRLLEFSAPGQFIEPSYYGILNQLRDLGYANISKVVDSSTAAEQSAAFFAGQQRQMASQDRMASQLQILQQSVGKLRGLVQELRDIDRRLDQFLEGEREGVDGLAAEAALKAEFINTVDGGVMNPASIFGDAQRLGIPELPDLFYPMRRPALGDASSVSEVCSAANAQLLRQIAALGISAAARDALTQKLRLFYAWKDSTARALFGQRHSLLARVKQEYATLQLALTWVKPHLRAMRQTPSLVMLDSPDLPSMFEVTMNELELLARKKVDEGAYAVLLVSMQFLTRPVEQPRGMVRPSSMTIQFRAYAWSDEEIARYLDHRQQLDMDVIGAVSQELMQQLKEMEEDMKGYLREAGVLPRTERQSRETVSGFQETISDFFGPLTSIVAGISQLLRWLFGERERTIDTEAVARTAKKDAWACYKGFKAAHGMVRW
jgi:DNA-binding transcriptional MerR regulator